MKKTLFAFIALCSVTMGETEMITLPETQQAVAGLGNATSITVSVNDASGISQFAGSDVGIYMFCNGGQTDIGSGTEGTWTLSNGGTATVELYGRKNWGGTNVAVLTKGNLNAGSTLSALTLTTTGLSGATDDYAVYFGIVDGTGAIIASSTQNNLGTGAANITLDSFGADASDTMVWENGYTILMGFVSEAGTSWDAKTYVNGIKVEATLVPEPTSATLSLLAFCSLAARRRRK